MTVLGAVGEPGVHPLGALEERERRLAGAADGAAADEAAGVDEADVVEDAAGRGEARRDGQSARRGGSDSATQRRQNAWVRARTAGASVSSTAAW